MSLRLTFYNFLVAPLPQRGLFPLRRTFLRFSGITVAPGARIAPGAKFIDRFCFIGADSWIGPEVLIHSCGLGPIHIGDRVDLAPRTILVSGTHVLGDGSRRAGPGAGEKIIIGDGTWVGANCTIIAGASIGKGSVVAAGSTVIRGTYPENALLAGSPAIVKRLLRE